MTVASPPELLVLHGVRLKGMADVDVVVRRFSLDHEVVEKLLREHETRRWVHRVEFGDLSGWALTEAGRIEDNRRLGAELAETGAGPDVVAAHATFARLNGRLLTAVTDWQIRPAPGNPMASNDHSDRQWDHRVLEELASLLHGLRPVGESLADSLARFDGSADRFATALGRVERGELEWVDRPGMDSCHMVWFELHEDLLATLGLERGQEN